KKYPASRLVAVVDQSLRGDRGSRPPHFRSTPQLPMEGWVTRITAALSYVSRVSLGHEARFAQSLKSQTLRSSGIALSARATGPLLPARGPNCGRCGPRPALRASRDWRTSSLEQSS